MAIRRRILWWGIRRGRLCFSRSRRQLKLRLQNSLGLNTKAQRARRTRRRAWHIAPNGRAAFSLLKKKRTVPLVAASRLELAFVLFVVFGSLCLIRSALCYPD